MSSACAWRWCELGLGTVSITVHKPNSHLHLRPGRGPPPGRAVTRRGNADHGPVSMRRETRGLIGEQGVGGASVNRLQGLRAERNGSALPFLEEGRK